MSASGTLDSIYPLVASLSTVVISIVTAICIFYFVIELFLRFWVSSSNKEFFMDILNIIDIMAILPFFSDILLVMLALYDTKHSNYSLILVFRIFRVFRICRVLKLLRNWLSKLLIIYDFRCQCPLKY